MDFPNFGLKGKIAIVTGGGTGIGQGIALALANAGADVVVTARRIEPLADTVKRIETMGRKSLAVPMDITKVVEIERMANEVASQFPRIDVLVNSSGVNRRMPALEVTEEAWDLIMATNLKGAFFVSQAVAKRMMKQDPRGTSGIRGKIIQIGSLTSSIGIANVVPYGTSKGGVGLMTKGLAIELAKQNITVNCIAPGFHRTPLAAKLFDKKEWVAQLESRVALGRAGTIDDILGTAVFLASGASDYITGEILRVDGGFTAGWYYDPKLVQ
jgi:2-deoxy-D-gluconate 3-dehydrogenase